MTRPHEPARAWDPEHEEADAEARPDRGRRLWWVVGGVGIAIAVALTVWFGLAATEDPVVVQDVGFERPGEHRIVMIFDVTREPGTVLSCTVTAMDSDYGRVGTTTHRVPASSERTTRVRAAVETTKVAVTATVEGNGCQQVE